MSPQRYSCDRDPQLGSDGRRCRPLDCPGARVLDGRPSDGRGIGGKICCFYKRLRVDGAGVLREGARSSKAPLRFGPVRMAQRAGLSMTRSAKRVLLKEPYSNSRLCKITNHASTGRVTRHGWVNTNRNLPPCRLLPCTSASMDSYRIVPYYYNSHVSLLAPVFPNTLGLRRLRH
jgi:hypothetical protein